MQQICSDWILKGWVCSWDGKHDGRGDFFGLPDNGPVYISSTGGMQNIPLSLVQDACEQCPCFKVCPGVRVENLKNENGKWCLIGKDGRSAYHDTPELEARAHAAMLLHEHDGYDIVVLTDISSSFENWHRASAGVPEVFAKQVRQIAGSRVPLFSCMVSFKQPLKLPEPVSSITFDENMSRSVWFAARSQSKMGFTDTGGCESWTIISTPHYAVQKIIQTPMQDPVTGAFIPQSADYLLSVPAPELCREFIRAVGCDENQEVTYINAQRWGSALPAHRRLAHDVDSPTRYTVAGVSYESGRAALAPTTFFGTAETISETVSNVVSGTIPGTEAGRDTGSDTGAEAGGCRRTQLSFVCDDSLGLLQCGDMVSGYTPGFEGAVLSATDAAEHLAKLIAAKQAETRAAMTETRLD